MRPPLPPDPALLSALALGVISLALTAVVPRAARAQETRFAVIDLDPKPDHEKLVSEVEREIARLRPGARRIEDEVVRRLFASGEGPAKAAQRLLAEAQQAKAAGDCKTAVERATASEQMLLTALTIDEERDPLKSLYILQVICEQKLGRAPQLALAAARLRSLVSLPPSDLPPELWQKHVDKASFGAARTELQVDSDPPNAQVSINLHGEGVTPRTLNVPPGPVFVEVQKEGYKKAFRLVEVKDRPVRAALRLVPRAQDRTEQAENQLRFLQKSSEDEDRTGTLSRLSQLARVETLVLIKVVGPDKVRISFFDAERGALAEAPVESRYDPATGKVAALANRTSPGGSGAGAGAKPAPAVSSAAAGGSPATPVPLPGTPAGSPPASAGGSNVPAAPPGSAVGPSGLPEAQAAKQQAQYNARRKRPGAPWWSWVIAGAVGVAFLGFMYGDQTQASDKIDVTADWPGGM